MGTLEAVHCAALPINGDGRVVDLNERAAEMVREGWLQILSRRIIRRNREDDAPLQHALSAAMRGTISAAPERLWFAPRKEYPDRPWCEIFPLPRRELAMLFRPRLLMVIRRAGVIDAIEADTLRGLLGLTASKADIALRLANGVARAETARIRGPRSQPSISSASRYCRKPACIARGIGLAGKPSATALKRRGLWQQRASSQSTGALCAFAVEDCRSL